MIKSPIPNNETQRLLSLASLDLDYTDLEEHFKEIVALTSKVSGMDISLINLIDPLTQYGRVRSERRNVTRLDRSRMGGGIVRQP